MLTVDADSHFALYWTIREGGSNLGCVSEFAYRPRLQSNAVFTYPLVFLPSQVPKVVKAPEDWYSTIDDTKPDMLISTTNGKATAEVAVFVFFNDEEDETNSRNCIMLESHVLSTVVGSGNVQ